MRGFLFDEGDELITRKSGVSGSAAHFSSEPVELTIDGYTYDGYPLDKTYKDLLEYPSPLYIEDENGIMVYFPMVFEDNAEQFDGYPFKVTFAEFISSAYRILYAESETGTLYYIPQE